MRRPHSWVTCLCFLPGGKGLSRPWLPIPQCQPCPSPGLPLPPSSPVGGGVSGWEGHGLRFYNVTTVGGGQGDVPCISVKYLIYLNINKNQTLCKIPCSLQLFWDPGWCRRQTPAHPAGSVDLLSVGRGLPLVFSLSRGSCTVFRQHDYPGPFSTMRTSVSFQICYSNPFLR